LFILIESLVLLLTGWR